MTTLTYTIEVEVDIEQLDADAIERVRANMEFAIEQERMNGALSWNLPSEEDSVDSVSVYTVTTVSDL